MDKYEATLEIMQSILGYDFYDTLISKALAENLGSHNDLQELRQKSNANLARLFPDTTFYDGKGKLLSRSELQSLVQSAIMPLSATELQELMEKLNKDGEEAAQYYAAIKTKRKTPLLKTVR
jgi:hypothetical protein